MNTVIYSNNIRAIRQEYSISQAQMADDLKIDRSTIHRIETGKLNPSLDLAFRISIYLEKMIPEVFPVSKDATLPTYSESKKG